MLINVKMATIVDIYEKDKFHAQLSWAYFYNPWFWYPTKICLGTVLEYFVRILLWESAFIPKHTRSTYFYLFINSSNLSYFDYYSWQI